ncbi:DUF4097 domain-containing protein [Bacillus salitolerans]|uniref:DUF4097 domain-containing protein n=1 Tax=Bacillus salitolerans TaxID=1437434 RepID=A0ABW4LWW8_9BACI
MAVTEQRKRILKMVEEGKLSAEEALILIENLEKDEQAVLEKEEEILAELSTEVKWEEQSQQDKGKTTKTTSVKDSVFDFVDKALKKIKTLDLDFNFGTSISVQHIFQHSNVYLTDIEIDIANGSVKLQPWDETDVRIECDAKVYQVESQDEARKTFLEDVLFSIEGGKLRYSVQKKKLKVNSTLYLPRTEFEKVIIRLFNGKIDGESLLVKEFKAKTANGKITLANLNTKKFEVETANGHITATNLTSEKVEAETINGTIKIDGEFSKADLQSFNGNVICSISNSTCDALFIKSTTGNVDLFVPKDRAIHGELKSNIGNFQVEIPKVDRKEEKSEIVQKYLKFVTPNTNEQEPLLIDVDTKTGSIVVKEKGGI